MRIGGGLLRGRSALQWWVGGVSLVASIGLLIAAIVLPIKNLDLRADGVRTTALVEDVQHSGRNTDYEVGFNLQDGTPFTTWTSDVDSGTPVGGSIEVAYWPGDPSSVEDVRDLGRWWAAPAVFGPMGGFFIWFGWRMWRATPESVSRALRIRSLTRNGSVHGR